MPEADYTTTIQSTSASDVPDVLELDGPTPASFVYDATVAPIDGYVSQDTIDSAWTGDEFLSALTTLAAVRRPGRGRLGLGQRTSGDQLVWSLVMSNPAYRPLPLELSVFSEQMPVDWGEVLAFGALVILPVLVFFVSFQRFFVRVWLPRPSRAR